MRKWSISSRKEVGGGGSKKRVVSNNVEREDHHELKFHLFIVCVEQSVVLLRRERWRKVVGKKKK